MVLNAWLSNLPNPSPIDLSNAANAAMVWAVIKDRATTIRVRRTANVGGGPPTTQPDQIVRIEYGSSAVEKAGLVSTPGEINAIVFGVKGLSGVPDTNLIRSDTFVYNNQEFEVLAIVPMPGGIQAVCRARD